MSAEDERELRIAVERLHDRLDAALNHNEELRRDLARKSDEVERLTDALADIATIARRAL